MPIESRQNLWWQGHDIGAHHGGIDNVLGAAYRGDQNLGVKIIIGVDAADFLDQAHAVLANVVKPSNERRYEAGAGLGRQKRLSSGKTQGDIDHCAFIAQRPAGHQPVTGQRYFYRDIWRNGGKRAPFGKHGFKIGGGHLGADWSGDKRAYFGDGLLDVAAGSGNERRIGGHPIDKTGVAQGADFGQVSAVEKNFHGCGSISSRLMLALFRRTKQVYVKPARKSRRLTGIAQAPAVTHGHAGKRPCMTDKTHTAHSNAPAVQTRVLSVAVAAPVAGVYDYLAGAAVGAVRGSLVMVPFGGRQLAGIVMGPGTGGVAAEKLRAIDRIAQLPPVSEAMLGFVERVADWTMTPLGAVVKMLLSQPMALARPPQKKHYRRAMDAPISARLTPARTKVLACLDGTVSKPAAAIIDACGVSQSVLDGMVAQGLLALEMHAADRPPPRPKRHPDLLTLTAEQQVAAQELVQAIDGGFQSILLDGVTGSGKTEVYFAAVDAAIAAGKQVLILLPEIALSGAWRQRFAARFGVAPVEWHSDVPPGQKRASWRFVLEGRATVVVGARSALFLPFDDLGLIIVDEEHEHAFKQEDQVIYQARDMAVLRARMEAVPIILASATPSLESWVNAGRIGGPARYRYLALPNRVQGASLPQIELVDLRATPPEPGRWLAPPLVAAMEARLAAGEQTLLYLNRRGYAPLTLCGACGSKLTCPNCDAWMVAHRLAGRMKCHHCGHESRPRDDCIACGESDVMRACGPGVERLAEEVLWRFPDARFAVLSSDTVGTPKAAELFVQSVIDGEVDIIIGTQMAAKGHHFPALTLVGVVDADLGLSGGDLRAGERTFQMLSQVAGRAGRESRPGTALMQTLEPNNQVLAALIAGDRDQFLAVEAAARNAARMPPFGQLAALILSAPHQDRLHQAMRLLDASRPAFAGVDIFGPAIAPIGFLKGKHRARALARSEKIVNIQEVVKKWLGRVKLPPGVRLQIDIDPYHFL